VQDELLWLGQALLNIAHNRAENDGISSEVVIRQGQVTEEICRFLDERSASLLLLGAPRNSTAAYYGDDQVMQFAQSIEEHSGVPVEIVRPEPVDISASS
jgi:nucleotide-binding universal stress UspA family protein